MKAVAFDMDGLMFDTERLNMEAWQYVGKLHGYIVSDKLIFKICGLNMADSRRTFLSEFGQNFDFDTYRVMKADYISDKIERDGVPIKKGLYELLEYLKSHGYKTVVATSTMRSIALRNLTKAGVMKYFDKVVYGDMVSRGKPEPDIFLKASEVLGVPPEECMALEDSANGILSAYRAGMIPVMIPDMQEPSEEIRRILFAKLPSLLDVIGLLEEQQSSIK